MRQAHVHRLAMRAPDDVSGLSAAIEAGRIAPAGIVGILGKTEGNGCVNDFTRAFAVRALTDALRPHLGDDALARVSMVMSGGTEGALSPHMLVLERRESAASSPSPALAVGSARSPDLPFEHLGRRPQALMVADAVRAAMADAGLDDPADVHFVQIKCPLLTAGRVRDAEARGQTVATRDTLKSMGLSRGASALGVAIALGEIEAARVTDDVIGRDTTLWSGRASTSGGVELLDHEVVVLGMSAAWTGPLVVDHAVMADQIDVEPVRAALGRLDLGGFGQIPAGDRGRLVALLAKAEAGTSGTLRACATPCSTTPTSRRPATRGPSWPARWPASSAMRRSSCPAAPNTRGRTAAARWRSSRSARRPIHPAHLPHSKARSLHDGSCSGVRGAGQARDRSRDHRHDQDLRLARRAWRRVDHVRPGSFHALLGENGAGKSTLVKCIMGFYQPTRGTVLVDGKETDIANPKIARDLGIGMVYQHFTLVPSLTATENLVIARAHVPAVIDWKTEKKALDALFDRMPFRVPLDVPVSSLAAGEKQKLEILKQLYLDQKFLILDEPTSVLTPGEADEILGLLRTMTDAGDLTILMISHKFREVTAFADEFTVLRRGQRVAAA
ncbi:Cyanuric acid amidohydrolase [Methylobrevis pamukkalensis]|uniref:Cyclic amide hydrolase n=1 Tax=Methylobrevis pamukkalensis TaxID=1439726 RepID=A0A1E3H0Y6_9HYPH|nr:Cyanuric acid amidohydrolase [Methylobrevis pamukkalensis]